MWNQEIKLGLFNPESGPEDEKYGVKFESRMNSECLYLVNAKNPRFFKTNYIDIYE